MSDINKLIHEANNAFQQKDIFKAHECFIKAVQKNSKDACSHSNLGACYIEMKQWKKACEHFKIALDLDPKNPGAHTNLSQAYRLIGRMPDAVNHIQKVIDVEPDSRVANSNLLLYLNYCPELSPKELFEYHKKWGQKFPPLPKKHLLYSNYPDPDRPLRIGFISPDFRGHSVGYFIEPALIHYRLKQLEVFCYAHVPMPDKTTQSIKKRVHTFRQIHKMDDSVLAHQIRSDGIDILVDLAGHTANSRVHVMALQPAPIQITYLGYPTTTGLKQIDYRLTDIIVDPEGESDEFHTEKLIRLTPHFFCFPPLGNLIPVSPLPALEKKHICFGGFHNTSKISDKVILLWSNVLKQVPDSNMMLQAAAYDDPDIVRYFQSCFENHGISKNRVKCVGTLPFDHYLRLHHHIDIMLDTFPWTGHTTSCHALWMGIPILTLKGNKHSSRIGQCLMNALDMPEWIADDHDSFVEKAHRFSQDFNKLNKIRAYLRNQILKAKISNKQTYAQSLENTFRNIWQHWCDEQRK
ncbi:TPR repeat-containing protein [Candidatus Magnetomorum sp. HK-1]|nr:TPR repeat-containing protein [Candidatus Magnetomorum sp. HK-1]